MSDDTDLTPEEASALEAMQNEPVEQQEPETPEKEPEQGAQPAEPADDQAAQKPPEGYVPHGAMHAERMERRRAEERASQLEQRLASLEEKLTKGAPEPEQKAPDPVVDPEGYNKWVDGRIGEVRKLIDTQQEQQRQSQQEAQLQAHIQRDYETYTQKNEDYQDALAWAAGNMLNYLGEQGLSEQQALAAVDQMAKDNARRAVEIGMSPAALMHYRIKQAGWQPKAKAADKIEATAKAQKQTQGLGNTGGGAPATKYTAEMLANMSQEEFDKIPDEEIDRVFQA